MFVRLAMLARKGVSSAVAGQVSSLHAVSSLTAVQCDLMY